MYLRHLLVSILLTTSLFGNPQMLLSQTEQPQGMREAPPVSGQAELWRQPEDIASRDLFYGPGGKADSPDGANFFFVKEDTSGTSPKFEVRDSNGKVWKVKLGGEARPETVATRLVWAVGYYADEDFLIKDATIAEMPVRLRRGQKLIHPGGKISIARFERIRQGKKGEWRWKKNPYSGSRELNGLRVVMALINNWDLKDINNTVLENAAADMPGAPPQIYLVSDLGATFGSPGFSWPQSKTRGNLKEFSRSKFINKVTDAYVDFKAPARPALIRIVAVPQFISRLKMRWIGRRIPRTDVQWIARLLGQLSPNQIRDAFRAAGYGPEEVDGYARVIESRIAELEKL